jgi:hypothetical protein
LSIDILDQQLDRICASIGRARRAASVGISTVADMAYRKD